MLPLISSLTTELAGLPGDATGDLPGLDASGGQFAGILKQSVAAKLPAEHGLSAGNALPPDGKVLPLNLEFELPFGDLSDRGTAVTDLTDSQAGLYGLGLMPKPIATAIASELAETSNEQPTDIERVFGELASSGRSQPAAQLQEPIGEIADPAISSVTPPLALIVEQRLRERNAPLDTGRNAVPTLSRPTDIGLAAVDLLSRGLGPAHSSLAPAPAIDGPNLTAALITDVPTTLAIQAGRVAAEAFGGAPAQLTGAATDPSAVLNNSSLPAHVSLAVSAPPGPPVSAPAATAAMHIGMPLQDAAWSNELGSRVVLMSGQQLQSAKIQLSPAELGPITVNLVVDDGSAELTFHAHHVLTRDAIEQALPRLREMLNDSGLTLGNATVSEQGVQKDGSGRASQQAGGAELSGDDAAGHERALEAQPTRVLQGLLDTFV